MSRMRSTYQEGMKKDRSLLPLAVLVATLHSLDRLVIPFVPSELVSQVGHNELQAAKAEPAVAFLVGRIDQFFGGEHLSPVADQRGKQTVLGRG